MELRPHLIQLGQHIVAFRDALQTIINDALYLNAMGGASFLEGAPFNLSPADALLIMNTIGQILPTNTIVQDVEN